jgi:flagellin
MALTINTNPSATLATMHLSKNNAALKKSLNRLSSGSRIVQPVDDAGGLAVSMKLESSIVRLSGAEKNIQNAQSFLEVQDGVLTSASKILNRMVELKGLSSDVMKNSSDQENYNREFQDLQMQMYDLANLTFNGVSLFATTSTDGSAGTFSNLTQDPTERNVVVVNVSADGTSGPQVSVNKALLLSALTIDTNSLGTGVTASDTTNSTFGGVTSGDPITFASPSNTEADALDLWEISVGVFQQAIENIATLRADNGGTMSRLRFAADDVSLQKTNLIAANGRIKDVDIATESTNLAKYQVLVQASASMLAQANTNTDIAMMLLR